MGSPRSRARSAPAETAPTPAVAPKAAPEAVVPALPYLLDFFPLESAGQTRVAPFFDHLRAGRFTTTRCRSDGWLWPPRAVCPRCHSEDLEWADLPRSGRIYAFSAVLAGAPLGMESDVPFAVGLVDLDGVPLRLFGRIVGSPWDRLKIGDAVRVEPFERGDGRVFYRFRRS